MSIYKLFGGGTGGTENSVANLDVQFEGSIVAIFGSMHADLDADAETCAAEVSFLSSNTVTTNDSRGSLFQMQVRTNETGTGKGDGSANAGISGLNIAVAAGERIHLHLVSTSGVVSVNHFYIYVDDQASPALRRRR